MIMNLIYFYKVLQNTPQNSVFSQDKKPFKVAHSRIIPYVDLACF